MIELSHRRSPAASGRGPGWLTCFLLPLFLLVFPGAVSADNDPTQSLLESAVFRQHWYALLHYRENGSQRTISDPAFYAASSEGKLPTPREELQVIREALQEEDTDIYCQFPARSALIKRAVENPTNLPDISSKCSLEAGHQVDEKTPLLGFASANDASIASIFGHIFLAIEPAQARLNATTITYAAQLDADREGAHAQAIGWKDAYRGLTGGLSGTYGEAPLHERLRVYNQEQQRSVWLYELTLSREEKHFLLWHLHELQGVRAPYRFLSHNCGYGALAVLDAALGTRLKGELDGTVAPQSVLSRLDKRDILDFQRVEPSTEKKIELLRTQVPQRLAQAVDSYLHEEHLPSTDWLEKYPQAAELFYLEIKKRHLEEESHWTALKRLGSYGTRDINWHELIGRGKDPRYAQPYRYIGLGMQSLSSDDHALLVSFSPGYKGPLGRPRGYPNGYGIQFLSGSLRVTDDGDIELRQLDFIHFENLAGQRTAYGDRATTARVQFVRRRYRDSYGAQLDDQVNVLETLLGAGLSRRLGVFRLVGLLDGILTTNLPGSEKKETYAYTGPQIKLIWQSLDWHARLSVSHRFALHAPAPYRRTLRLQGSWYPTERMGLIIKAERLQGVYRESYAQAGIRFHF